MFFLFPMLRRNFGAVRRNAEIVSETSRTLFSILPKMNGLLGRKSYRFKQLKPAVGKRLRFPNYNGFGMTAAMNPSHYRNTFSARQKGPEPGDDPDAHRGVKE